MKLRRMCTALLLSGLLLSCLSGCSGTTDELRFGTGGTGGTYYAFGSALAPQLQNDTGSTVEVKVTNTPRRRTEPAAARWPACIPRPVRLW